MLEDNCPLICLPYSPNWYYTQICYFYNNVCCFGTNTSIHQFSLPTEQPHSMLEISLTPEKLYIKKNEKQQQAKITAVWKNDEWVLGGLNNGFLAGWQRNQDRDENVVFQKVCQNEIVFIKQHPSDNNQLLVFDVTGGIVQLTLSNKTIVSYELNLIQQNQIVTKENEKVSNKLKRVFLVNKTLCWLAFENGRVQLFNFEEKKILFTTYFYDHKILNATYFCSNDECQFLFLLKHMKDKILKLVKFPTTLYASDQQELETSFFEHFQGSKQGPKQIIIKINYQQNSKQYQKLYQKGSMCVHLLSGDNFLLTGKSGEIYLCKILLFNKGNQCEFKPFGMKTLSSELDKDEFYSIVNENQHSNCIYSLIQTENKIITIGIDRKIVFWEYDQTTPELTYSWKLQCLNSKIISLIPSPVQKHIVLLQSIDNEFKLLNLASYQSYEVCNKIKNIKISFTLMSPMDEGILVFYSEDALLLGFYDIYTDSFIKTYKLKEKVLHFSFVSKQHAAVIIQGKLENFIKKIENKSSVFNVINRDQKWLKHLSDQQFILLISASYNCALISSTDEILYQFTFINQPDTLEYIHLAIPCYTMRYQGIDIHCLLYMFGTKTGNIAVEIADSEGNWDRKEIKKLSSHPISAIRCATIVREKEIKFAVSSFDRSLKIFALNVDRFNKFQIDLEELATFKLKTPIVNFKWSTTDQILCLGVKDSTIQILNCQKAELIKQKQELESVKFEEQKVKELQNENQLESCYVANIRGHTGFITDAEFVNSNPNWIITSSDDQTIKVWDLQTIKNKKPKNKPKKQKKQQKQKIY